MVTLPDHVPSALHERKEDPPIWYPVSQEREAWEPNEDPQEREGMDPGIGGWRTGHDFAMDETDLPLIKCLQEKSVRILINKSLNALFVCIVCAHVYECSARVPLGNIFSFHETQAFE